MAESCNHQNCKIWHMDNIKQIHLLNISNINNPIYKHSNKIICYIQIIESVFNQLNYQVKNQKGAIYQTRVIYQDQQPVLQACSLKNDFWKL